ncbi:MAG: thioredoxin [Proteocatella sp.]
MPAFELNKENFEEEVYNSSLPVLIDFWAPWCGPCKEVLPMVEELADELSGKVKVCKLNVDGNKEIARKFRVMTIPTVIIFNKGVKIKEQVYPKNRDELLALLEGL